jgi:serine protease
VRIMGRCGGNTADVAAAILWAAGEPVPGVPPNENPARIINLSLSGAAERCPRALQTAVDKATERGSVVVVAAGSAARSTAKSTPANCEGVLVVGSTDRLGQRSPTSNFGSEVSVSTFGGDLSASRREGVWTTTNTGAYRPKKPTNGYFEGSSAAAAQISGALAALVHRHPGESNQRLIERLQEFTTPFGQGQCDKGEGACGRGIVDLDELLALSSN